MLFNNILQLIFKCLYLNCVYLVAVFAQGSKNRVKIINYYYPMSQVCDEDALDAHEVNRCFYPKGGIPSVGVLRPGHNIADFSNAIETQAAIDAGTLVIFDKVKASLEEPSPVEGPNVTGCGAENIVDGFNYVLAFEDYNVNSNNDALIPQLNSGEFEGIVFFMCDQDAVRVALQKVTFVASIIIPATKREKQYYSIKANWYQSAQTAIPTIYDAPEGIYYQN